MRVTGVICALAMALVPVAAAAQERDSATFDIYLRGIRAAQLTYSTVEDGGRYSAAAKMQSSGIVGFVRTVTYEATAQGSVRGSTFVPSIYSEKRNNDGRVRTVRMRYRRGVPQGREMTPARPPRPDDLDPAAQGGTWDVMTAIFAVFRSTPRAEVCNLNQLLFDGRRVARISMSGPRESNGAISCAATYSRVAGYPASEMAERTDFPFTLTYTPAGNGEWRVTEVKMESIYGSGRMVRR